MLLGEKERVHFVRLEEGSTVLVRKIGPESLPKVRSRLQKIDVAEGEGPKETLRAFKAIHRRLAQDNAVGHLYEESGAKVIYFPSCKAPKPLTFLAFTQRRLLDPDAKAPQDPQTGQPVTQVKARMEYADQAKRENHRPDTSPE